jgi:hypothetical protein
MATTTNYGWATPDDTDLVKDGAAAIRTLGTSIDTSFAAVEGDLLVGGISDIFEALPIGAAGTVLTSDGDTAEWVAPASGGKVLQVVMGTTTTQTTIATTSFTDTTLTASITPSSATSKVLVLVSQQLNIARTAADMGAGMKILRDATDIVNIGPNGYETVSIAPTGASSVKVRSIINYSYLDTPATTSATTYKTQVRAQTTANSGSVIAQDNSVPATIILLEIGA